MRVVVADATPLHYLILIGAINVLSRIFDKIHVPIEVRDELTCDAAPPSVRTWMQQPPQWLEVLAAPAVASEDSSLQALDSGERAAIVLAESIHADLLLIDDRAPRSLLSIRSPDDRTLLPHLPEPQDLPNCAARADGRPAGTAQARHS